MIDEKYIKLTIEIILEYKKVSAVFLQRKLNIGFATADKIMDELENRGIVGPQVGAKPREIYFDNIKIDE